MQDYSKVNFTLLREMAHFVEEDTVTQFDYLSPSRCIFGIGLRKMDAGELHHKGTRDMSLDRFGLSQDQFDALFLGLPTMRYKNKAVCLAVFHHRLNRWEVYAGIQRAWRTLTQPRHVTFETKLGTQS